MIETQISLDFVFRRQSFNNNVHLAARLQLPASLVPRSNNGIYAECHYCARTKQLADSLVKNPSRTSYDAPVIAYKKIVLVLVHD
jgi:hypothetical protein